MGLYPSKLKRGSKTAAGLPTIKKSYSAVTVIAMSLTMLFARSLKATDLYFSGVSPDNRLVEIVEIPENKFFVACQYHPELSSRPNRPEGLIRLLSLAAGRKESER